jgi:hypothetical protein
MVPGKQWGGGGRGDSKEVKKNSKHNKLYYKHIMHTNTLTSRGKAVTDRLNCILESNFLIMLKCGATYFKIEMGFYLHVEIFSLSKICTAKLLLNMKCYYNVLNVCTTVYT